MSLLLSPLRVEGRFLCPGFSCRPVRQTVEADAVFSADGVRSCLRKQLLLCGGAIDMASTGDAAFRIMIPCSQMRGDPDIEALISELADPVDWF